MGLHLSDAPGLHRLEAAHTNCFLLEGDDGRGLTLVDGGVPAHRKVLDAALAKLGRTLADVEAIVLTHAHFDHVGIVEPLRSELGVPVYVHALDEPLCAHPLVYRTERRRELHALLNPQALPILAALAKAGAFRPPAVTRVTTYADGDVLPVPGAPRAVFTPGHTDGHCALHLPDRDAVVAGDAIVTLDPYTGRRGPRLVARAATADVAANCRSLSRIADTGARRVLVGHGDTWGGGAAAAAQAAHDAGSA